MIEHLVLFKTRTSTTREAVDRMMVELRSLRETVPEIRELTCGANFSQRSQGFTHGLLVRFATRSDLDTYIAHPEHQRIVTQFIQPIVENILVVDYEVRPRE